MKKNIIAFAALLLLAGATAAQGVRVATYNIRQDNKNDVLSGNGWKQRCPVICSQILFHDFDIFGAQEVFKRQLDDMLAGLPGYAYTGVGRSDGKQKGEYSPIFYKTERFDMLRSGHFWLSETPDKPLPGWDARIERICSWGEFRDKQTGVTFLFFNTHFDHVGVVARSKSAEMIIERIAELAGDDATAIVMGDFNVDQNSEAYATMVSGGVLRDCYGLAPVRMAWNGTFNSFEPDSRTASRIDHIFVTRGVEVKRYGVLTDFYWSDTDQDGVREAVASPAEPVYRNCRARTPSDHYPVMVQIVM